MKKCIKCSLTEGRYNVLLNEEGVCNYCDFYESYMGEIANFEQNEAILKRRFEKTKGKYEYDALCGLSGGKDSSYVLYQLVEKYKLNVLAVTYDHGFITDFTRNTIDKIVNKLGVKHYWYKPNWDIHKRLYKRSIEKFGDPCIACAFVGFFLSFKVCYEKQIPFFIHGRTPQQMFKNFYVGCKDMFFPIIKANLSEHSFEMLSKVNVFANENMKRFVGSLAASPEEAKEFIDEFFIDSSKMTSEFTAEFLAYFLFERYNEQNMKNKLREAFDWVEHPGESLLGHNDCAINAAASHFFKELHGADVLEREVGARIRLGETDKEQGAAAIAASQPSSEVLDSSLDEICKLCDCNRQELDKTIQNLKETGIPMFSSR